MPPVDDRGINREIADAARAMVARAGRPTARDAQIAAKWYRLLVAGALGERELAELLSLVRFDADTVRRLEAELLEARHELARARGQLEALCDGQSPRRRL